MSVFTKLFPFPALVTHLQSSRKGKKTINKLILISMESFECKEFMILEVGLHGLLQSRVRWNTTDPGVCQDHE